MKNHEWVIAVLADITDYAENNGLTKLAEATPMLRIIAEQDILGGVDSTAPLATPRLPILKVIEGGPLN